MKQQILEKLFSDKPLTSDEILHISSHLREEEQVSTLPPYDHDKDGVLEACGVEEKDIDSLNKEYERISNKKEEELESDGLRKSVQVEIMEGILENQKFRRIASVLLIKHLHEAALKDRNIRR